MTFELRRAAVGDHARLLDLLGADRDVGENHLDTREVVLYLQAPDRHAYVFGEAGTIEGVVLLRDSDLHSAELIDVAAFHVRSVARRRGLGRQAWQTLRQRYPQSWRMRRPAEHTAAAAFWRSMAAPGSAARSGGRVKPSPTQATAHGAPLLLPPSFDAEAALGQPAGGIRLAAHAPAWAALYAQERHRIESSLGRLAVEVQHVGSTAVPDLHAVPTIDMAVGVDPGTLSASMARLQSIGYRDGGRSFERNGYLLEKVGPRGRTHSLHLLPWTGLQCPDSVLARDHLRTNVAARAEYQVIKRHLVLSRPGDRRGYAKAKAAALSALVAQARARRAVLAQAGFSFPLHPLRRAVAD